MPFSNGVISIFANIPAHDCIIAGCGVNVLCRAFFISTYLESSILKLVKKGVNALYRAFFISTLDVSVYAKPELDLCQCPVSGFLHFYRKIVGVDTCSCSVSMPCIGLSSFLRVSLSLDQKQPRIVSMPYIGLSSFLRDERSFRM